MRKLLFVCIVAVAAGTILCACHGKRLRGKGAKITQSVAVTPFNSLLLEESVKTIITVQPGAQPSLQLKGYENILQHIKTVVENNQLHISSDLENGVSLDKHDGTTAEIIVPSLSALDLSGASDIEIHGDVTGDSFAVQVAGAGNIVADNLNVKGFTTQISGAGNVEIKGGTVQSASFVISGAGKISSFPLQAADVTIGISGAAKADITATKTLNVDINGAGKVKYKGHPVVTKDISGAGSIREVN